MGQRNIRRVCWKSRHNEGTEPSFIDPTGAETGIEMQAQTRMNANDPVGDAKKYQQKYQQFRFCPWFDTTSLRCVSNDININPRCNAAFTVH